MLDEILTKQFDMVEAQYDEQQVKEPLWFMKHNWSEDKQNEFKLWLINYLNKAIRLPKKLCEKHAAMFILNYGWTTKDFGDSKDGI